MCGLVGFLGRPSSSALEAIVGGMGEKIRHRGPDDGGAWADRRVGIAFAHRRLSVVDLSLAGHQPMESACGRYVLVFNGEIYNHLGLRDELEAARLAPTWRGHSDTETLLAGFATWGVSATLQRAVGMFALALWDRSGRSLTLARDRLGEKPLYYGWAGDGTRRAFVFGSELKALRAYPGFSNPISRDALALYMQFCSVPAPYSIYENLFKLSPGCILTVPGDACEPEQLRIEPYWRVADVARQGLANAFRSEAEALAELEAALREAVALQAVADVPLGAFLSGGVDSSTIVALMQNQSARPVQTFTVGFDEAGFDESPHALAVARHLGTQHHELRVTAADARAVIPWLPELYDEPFSDSSQIPTAFVCRAARREVTVALSGDGGDELFGGYNRYLWAARVLKVGSRLPSALSRSIGATIRTLPVSSWNALGNVGKGCSGASRLGDKLHKLSHRLQAATSMEELYRSLVCEWPRDAQLVRGAGLLPTQLDDLSQLAGVADSEQRMMLLDSLTYLADDILTKVDRAAMGVSLETRVPFLDHRVVALAWRLPLHMKIRHGQGKWALRKILYKHVPRKLIERPKTGFSIPVGDWLRGPLRDWANALLDEARLVQEGYLDEKAISETWRQHLSGRYDWATRLWSVLMFQAWLEANS
jgi:asparagine synthase (glutamine-hydrolysing)